MSVEFTHVPTTSRRHLPQYLSPENPSWGSRDAPSRRQAFEAAFSNIVIDGPAGILTNMDVAAETARATSTVGIALTHWSGIIHPVVAAQQIAALDRLARRPAVASLPARTGRPGSRRSRQPRRDASPDRRISGALEAALVERVAVRSRGSALQRDQRFRGEEGAARPRHADPHGRCLGRRARRRRTARHGIRARPGHA